MLERFVDEVFDALAEEEYDAGYDEDFFADMGVAGDAFQEDEADESIGESQCPGTIRTTLSGYPRYRNAPTAIPGGAQRIRAIANQIVRSFQPPCRPIGSVQIIGHAD